MNFLYLPGIYMKYGCYLFFFTDYSRALMLYNAYNELGLMLDVELMKSLSNF
jgi:hypothetical protein